MSVGVEKTVDYSAECKWFWCGRSSRQYLCSSPTEVYPLQIGVKVRVKF